MKISQQQLTPHLQQHFAPVYLVSGDEPLLVQEACDAIRHRANEIGFTERERFYVEPGFNWQNFFTAINNRSIFGEQILTELSINSKITEDGKKILQAIAEKPPKDKRLLIVSEKIDTNKLNTGWYKTIITNGVLIQIWPIDATQLPSWVANRLRQAGFNTDLAGAKLIADHAAGNLLAASQQIEKMKLIFGSGALTNDQIMATITDNSRFSVFDLVDATLQGNRQQTVRIIENLKNEKLDPVIILWAIARELRSLINIVSYQNQGHSIDQALQHFKVWNKHQGLVKQVLKRHQLTQLNHLLDQAQAIDLIVKGATSGNAWHQLTAIFLKLSDQ